MASRAQITRLEQRIEDLAERGSARQPRKVARIMQEKYRGETKEEAMAKHFAQHPQDAGADVIILSVII